MKRIYKTLLSSLAMTTLVAACANEDTSQTAGNAVGNAAQEVTTTFTSTAGTRTTMEHVQNGPGKFFWEAGDQIWVDNGTTRVASTTSNITGKTNHARFQLSGSYLNSTYPVYYTGQGSTSGDEVEIKATQAQTAANSSAHLGASGDCGYALAQKKTNGFYFALEHQATYLYLLPRSENALIRQFVIEKVTVTADKDIAGKFPLTATGLATTPSSNGSKTITLTVPQLPLRAVATPEDNALYIVMAPQTTALNVVYHLRNIGTGMTGTVTKNFASATYLPNTVYDLTSNLGRDYSREVTPYMWDAKKWYYDGQTPPYTPAKAPQNKTTDPLRWFNDEFTENGPCAVAQNSCRDCPNQFEMAWYLIFGPYWDAEELWTANNKVYKGVIRLKKWAHLVADHGASSTAIPTTLPPSSSCKDQQAFFNLTDHCVMANNFSVSTGIPTPTEMTKYFALPAGSDESQATYWTSTGTGVLNGYKPYPLAPYLGIMGSTMFMGNYNYIGRARTEPYRAVKFE